MKTSTSIQSNNRTIEQSNNFRRGSALLIVLGMLSFMVVSAVGFSVYMRQGRAPSSYLRRNVASRYLVKAALANAIEDLDGGFMSQFEIGLSNNNNPETGYFYGIYDDPYPGVGSQMNEGMSQVNGNDSFTRNGNFWFKRVFCPFGPLAYPQNLGEAVDEPSETVPTLTLEALAYLPPAIIDDVRKVSRLTRTAKWKSLPYQTGRYAYTAVNVSDMFDINRLQVSVPRNSGRDRISLSSLASSDPEDPSTVNAGQVNSIDTILQKLESTTVGGSIVPFTSLADFNLAAAGSDYAPFMKYIGSGNGQLLQNSSAEMANALFTTDTWFPTTNRLGETVFNLGGVDGPHQPFKQTKFTASSWIDVYSCKNNEDNVGSVFEKNIGLGLVCLYDYLDSDSVPVSLALPTTEAVPMVVGVSAPAGIQPTFDSIGASLNGQFVAPGYYLDSDGNRVAAQVTVKRTLQQKGITSFGNAAMVQCLAAYPFKRMSTSATKRKGVYTYRGIMKVWLAPEGMGCRPAVDTSLYPFAADVTSLNSSGLAKNGVATFASDSFTAGRSLNAWSTDVKKTEEALETFTLQFRPLNVEMPVYWEVTEQIDQNVPGHQLQLNDPTLCAAQPYQSVGNMQAIATSLRPLDLTGKIHGDWTTLTSPANAPFNINQAGGVTAMQPATGELANLRLYVAVWVQMLENGKVVDMVPACLTDDIEWLGSNVPANGTVAKKCGDGAPLLNFMSSTVLAFDTTLAQTAAQAPTFTWKELYAVDPRFNYAPEDWYASQTGAGTVNKNTWMTDLGLASGATSPLLGQNGRDRDIFMFVSDQEYLQSIGELQFLPVLDFMDGSANFMNGNFAPDFNGKSFATRTSPTTGDFANGGLFWRTYSGYKRDTTDQLDPLTGEVNGTQADTQDTNPYRMKYNGKFIKFVSDIGTFKVNPFSDDYRVLSAALVNTPFDYYVTSTNENQQQSGGKKNLLLQQLDFNSMKATYAWGSAPLAKMGKDTMLDVMDALREGFDNAVQQGKASDWMSAWNALEWQPPEPNFINEQNNEFMGVTLETDDGARLHGVDRKFLYSFWRDCFDNSQQLFLVFVRAEPSSVGAGAAGGVSAAQLGGRAVALVWRDPSIPSGVGGGSRPDRRNITSRDAFRDLKSECPSHRTRVLFYHQFD